MTARQTEGVVYGTPDLLNRNQQAIWTRVTRAASDLRGQLQELVQVSHRSAQPEDVEVVRALLFRAHGYARDGVR